MVAHSPLTIERYRTLLNTITATVRTLVRTGVAPMYCGCTSGNLIRFGDYSGIAVDGSNASSVWIAGEYGNTAPDPTTTPPPPASPTWGTEIGEYNY